MTASTIIEARDVTAAYENVRARTRLTALSDVDLDIGEGEFVAIVGPSGCGKTTFLNMVAGFIKPVAGTLKVRGAEVTGPGADRAMVFQDYALLPWRTVERNVRFGVEMRAGGQAKAELGAHPEYISGDGFHPSSAGYRRIADLVLDTLRRHDPALAR